MPDTTSSKTIGIFQKINKSGSVENSLGRILQAVIVAAGVGTGIYAIASGNLTTQAAWYSLGLVGLGLTGKVVQGGIEGMGK